VDVHVSLIFPDNDIHEARVTVTARTETDLRIAPSAAPLPVAKHLEPVWNSLRSIGGVANAASTTADVRCTIDGGKDAVSVPRAGGVADAAPPAAPKPALPRGPDAGRAPTAAGTKLVVTSAPLGASL
jgi:hypothetical protein